MLVSIANPLTRKALHPNKCIVISIVLKAKMANSTEHEIKSLQSSLQTLQKVVQTDLQDNVFKK